MRRALLTVLFLLGCSAAAFAQRIELQQVATGLNRPVSITHAGDNRLFITLQGGQIVVFDGTSLLPTPFLDIAALIGDSSNERGLLGLAFHPRYSENGLFFVNYTNTSGDTVVARYRVSSGNPNRADASTARIILHIDQPYANHNGGQLAFGPDGYLYVGMGDGGSGGDPGNRAQNLNELLGKMLRIDVDSGNAAYLVPSSNPYANRAGARGEIWASGLRNPWRFSFDRASGDLYIADVGQGEREEISFAPATSIGGENYGWRRMEGSRCYSPSTGCNDGSLVLPIIEYDHSVGCSVTGGYVYRGTRYPRLLGQYIYGDYCSGVIFAAARDGNGVWSSRPLLRSPHRISTFGEDAAGELYVARHSSTDGAIYRITDAEPLPPKRRSARR